MAAFDVLSMHSVWRTLGLVCLACLLAAGGGCGRDGLSRAAVSGQITVDGVAVEGGLINFTPNDGNDGPVAGGNITNGNYSIDNARGPQIGMNLITIYGSRKTGRKVASIVGGALVDETVSMVPERYNERSTLKREVKPGKSVLDFQLSSK